MTGSCECCVVSPSHIKPVGHCDGELYSCALLLGNGVASLLFAPNEFIACMR